MRAWQAGFWLLDLLLLTQNALAAHKVAARSSLVGEALDHRALTLSGIRKGAASRRDELLQSIQSIGKKRKRAESDITWQVTPFNPTSIPLAVRR